jgi:hypothetical protein
LAFRGPDYAARVRFPGGEIHDMPLDAPAAVVPGQGLRLGLVPGPTGLLTFPRAD